MEYRPEAENRSLKGQKLTEKLTDPHPVSLPQMGHAVDPRCRRTASGPQVRCAVTLPLPAVSLYVLYSTWEPDRRPHAVPSSGVGGIGTPGWLRSLNPLSSTQV